MEEMNQIEEHLQCGRGHVQTVTVLWWLIARREQISFNCLLLKGEEDHYPTGPWVNVWPKPTYHTFIIRYLKRICQAGRTARCPLNNLINILSPCSKAGIADIFESHQGPITGIDSNAVPGAIDFSHYFLTSSFDWTVKLWNIKVPVEKNL